MGEDEPDVLSVGDADRLEDAALEYIRSQLDIGAPSGPRRATEAFFLAALEGLPWVGGFVAAAAALRSENTALRRDSLHSLWLEQHEAKLRRLRILLDEMKARFDGLGEEVKARIESEEYLQLVRKGFRVWDRADTDEKRRYMANLLTNAGGGPRVTSDDVVRLFIEWIDQYHEAHFTVIREIYQHRGTTRLGVWTRAWGAVPAENSPEADLFRRLIRDLSTGGVIRQARETNAAGDFLRRQAQPRTRGPRPTTLETSFDNEDPYELTALGEQFVHYALTELVPRIGSGG